MNLILSGRGISLDEPLRRYVTEKLTKVDRFFDRIIKMEVELSREKNRHGPHHRVEVTVSTPVEIVRAHGEDNDQFAAIDKAADKLETRMRRLHERLRQHPHREPRIDAFTPEDDDGEVPGVPRHAMQVAKPLSIEEAQLELESRGFNFLLFTDADTMQPAVLYRRADGSIAVIDYMA